YLPERVCAPGLIDDGRPVQFRRDHEKPGDVADPSQALKHVLGAMRTEEKQQRFGRKRMDLPAGECYGRQRFPAIQLIECTGKVRRNQTPVHVDTYSGGTIESHLLSPQSQASGIRIPVKPVGRAASGGNESIAATPHIV